MAPSSCTSPLNIQPSSGEVLLKDVTYDRGLPCRASNERTAWRLFELLYSHLGSEPELYTATFTPALLFAICEALRQDLPGDASDVLLLPKVLSKLRSWRLLDRPLRHSFESIQKLAIDLAEMPSGDVPFQTSAGGDQSPSRPPRLRIKWAGVDLSATSHNQSSFEFRTMPPSPVHKGRQLEMNETHIEGTVHDVFRKSSLCIAHSAGAQDDPTVGFRSGCSACRRPRVSLPSTPQTPHLSTASLSSESPSHDRVITTRGIPEKPTPNPQSQKRVKVSKIPTLAPRKSEVDENEPPVRSPANNKPRAAFPRRTVSLANAPIVTFPMLHTTSDASASPPSSSPAASVGGVLQRSPISNIDYKSIEIRRGNVNRRVASNDLRPTAPVICASASDLRVRPSRTESFPHRRIPPSGPTPKSKMPKLIPNRTLPHSSIDPELVLPPAIVPRSVKARITPASTPVTSEKRSQKLNGGHVSAVRSSIPQPMNTRTVRGDPSSRKTSRSSFTTPISSQTRNRQS